jgi:hypothetical protein
VVVVPRGPAPRRRAPSYELTTLSGRSHDDHTGRAGHLTPAQRASWSPQSTAIPDPDLGARARRASPTTSTGCSASWSTRIFAGGPFSGRHGGGRVPHLPALRRLEELAWRTRIEGSQGRPEREINGRVIGWQEHYRDGLAALGADFAEQDAAEQDARLDAIPDFRALLYEHACEGMYGDPVYGGNRDGVAWRFIEFPGDVLPRGWTAVEVTGRD